MAAQPHLPSPPPSRSTAARPPSRPYYPLKSQWALAQAAAVREQLRKLDAAVVPPGDWRAGCRMRETRTLLLNQEADWKRRAAQYQLQERRSA